MELENGILLLDKPYGHSSHEITTYIKKLLGVSRAGHAGTLDPQVSGVLPIALGRATKLLQYIATKRKTYVGIIKFKHILSEEKVQQLFQQFTGEITQTPPRESAVQKVARKRTIYTLQFLEQSRKIRALFYSKPKWMQERIFARYAKISVKNAAVQGWRSCEESPLETLQRSKPLR